MILASRQALIVQGNSVVGAAVAYAMDLVYTAPSLSKMGDCTQPLVAMANYYV